ncbi:MAG: hypothetical protein KBD76_09390 [Bacteriovorax sp.]|nr:hypothetical protein [Bacteriovorax sp.]
MNRAILAISILFYLCSLSCTSFEGKKNPLSSNEYWSEMVSRSIESKTSLLTLLQNENPQLFNQIKQDSLDSELEGFWGQSLNFDSGAKKQIIDDAIISELQEMFHLQNDNKIVHAGVTHSYGYLFSVLNTPYGYKRKRWIDPTLNFAFSFKGKSLSPEASEGGLLSNLTYFVGSIAFKSPKEKESLKKLKNVSSEVMAFSYEKLKTETLEEEVTRPASANHVLRTTLVKLPLKKAEEENDYLLIYSILNSVTQKEVLITAFPITTGAYLKIVESANLGEGRPIVVRYNAYLEGFMEQNLTGPRILY